MGRGSVLLVPGGCTCTCTCMAQSFLNSCVCVCVVKMALDYSVWTYMSKALFYYSDESH